MNGKWRLFHYIHDERNDLWKPPMLMIPLISTTVRLGYGFSDYRQVYTGTWDECIALGKLMGDHLQWWDDAAPQGLEWKHVGDNDER